MSAENDLLVIALVVLALLIALGWYLSYSAARLDRLHAKVEGAMSVLDAQLVRRAEASLELATSGALDPASSLFLADAASGAIRRRTEHPIGDDPLDGQHFAGREGVESDLSSALATVLSDDQPPTRTAPPRVKRGMAEMLKGGVIMDVVTPSRPRSPRTPAPSPSWRSSGCRPTSAPRAASRG
jgi:hypothetical protein